MQRSAFLGIPILAASFISSPILAQAPASRPAQDRVLRERLLQRFDKDGDGRLSQEERQAARKAMQQRDAQRAEKPDADVPADVRAMRDIEYAKVDGKPLLLDVFVPRRADKPMPVVVWIHGGGWRAGSKERCPTIPLTARGYGVVSINYRLTDAATFPAQIHDCKGAIRWVRAHASEYGFDPDRIGVWGASAGGHLVALLGTSGGNKEIEGDVGGNLDQSSRAQAVADFCGPTSFLEFEVTPENLKRVDSAGSALARLLGGPPSEKKDAARAASSTTYVSKDDPPFLIVHGDQDPLVPVQQARILADKLKQAGVDVTLHIMPGAGHGVINLETAAETAAFFDRVLKRGSAGGAARSATASQASH